MRPNFIIALGLATAQSAQAYYPLSTDDAGTQGKGAWQAESYLEWLSDDSGTGKSRERVVGLTLSYGVSESLDVGIGVGHSLQRGVERVSGVNDSALGLKWRFYERQNWSLAFSSILSLPTGKEERGLGAGRPGLALNTIATVALSKTWNAHGNIILEYVDFKSAEDTETKRATVWRASAALDKRLGENWLVAMESGIAQAEEKLDDRYPTFGMIALVYSPSSRMDLSVGYRFALSEPEGDQSVLVGVTAHW